MGLEMELYTDTRLEEDVKRSLVYKKTRKKTIPFECDMLI